MTSNLLAPGTVLKITAFLAPTLSLTTSSFILGHSSYISPLIVLDADNSPSKALKQLRPFFEGGKYVFPPLSIVTTALWSSLAYALPAKRIGFAIAAIGSFSIIPFTSLYMIPYTNNAILDLDDRAKQGDRSVEAKRNEVQALVTSFAKQNIWRGGLYLVGGMVGLWTVLA